MKLVRLCLLAVGPLLGCGGATEHDHTSPSDEPELLGVTLVSGTIDRQASSKASRGRATFRVRNEAAVPVGFWGINGVAPIYRIAVRDGDRWVENQPAWIECATGLEDGRLEPSAIAQVDAFIPSVDAEFRIAVGCWDVPGDRVPWPEWHWTWSDPFVLADVVRLAGSANGGESD